MADINPKDAGPKPPFPQQTQDAPGIQAQMKVQPISGEDTYVGHDKLKDKVAIITGGDSGIGRAVALAFAREGADVAISYLPEEEEDAKETERLVHDSGRTCLRIPGDISNEEQCNQIVKQTVDKFGRIDILVNNAAYQPKAASRFEEITYDRVMQVFKVNIIAMFALTRAALAHMKEGGSVINVGSIQAYQPSNSILDYASTKGAIVAFTKGLAKELCERGIRVNCVAPGPVWTPLIQQSFPAEKVGEFGKQSPMKRPAQPSELSPAFVFLASSDGSYVNGEVLGVTGGSPLG